MRRKSVGLSAHSSLAGIEFDINKVSVYADVEVPVMQDFVGNQLVAPWLFKMYVSYMF